MVTLVNKIFGISSCDIDNMVDEGVRGDHEGLNLRTAVALICWGGSGWKFTCFL